MGEICMKRKSLAPVYVAVPSTAAGGRFACLQPLNCRNCGSWPQFLNIQHLSNGCTSVLQRQTFAPLGKVDRPKFFKITQIVRCLQRLTLTSHTRTHYQNSTTTINTLETADTEKPAGLPTDGSVTLNAETPPPQLRGFKFSGSYSGLYPTAATSTGNTSAKYSTFSFRPTSQYSCGKYASAMFRPMVGPKAIEVV